MEMKELVLLWMATALAASAAEVLDESNKMLTAVPTDFTSSITGLILHNNSIAMNSSDTNILSLMVNLTELDLSYNRIAELSGEAFSGLRNLEVLNLSGNQLQTIKNETLIGLKNLKKLDLQENPWNCSCIFLNLIKWMSDSGVQTVGGSCVFPEHLKMKGVLDVMDVCSTITITTTTVTTASPPTTTTITTTSTAPRATPGSTVATTTTTTTFTSAQWTSRSSTLGNSNISNKDSLSETGNTGRQKPGGSNTWKFLAGVIVIALCTSMFIVCAVKSPSWYKLLFNYRHQRLREVEEPHIFGTSRYSNFSLDTEQTETSAHELDQGLDQPLEDEDGFIEDRYIQPEDYKEHTEDYIDHVDAGEV